MLVSLNMSNFVLASISVSNFIFVSSLTFKIVVNFDLGEQSNYSLYNKNLNVLAVVKGRCNATSSLHFIKHKENTPLHFINMKVVVHLRVQNYFVVVHLYLKHILSI